MRYTFPVLSFARTAPRDVELNGDQVSARRQNGPLLLPGQPRRDRAPLLALQRTASAQVGFGGGSVHFCLGSRLARMQVRAVLRETYARLPNLALGTPNIGFGESVHSVVSLGVTRS